MQQFIRSFAISLILFSLANESCNCTDKKNSSYTQEEITIVVTDSGLGGLAVMDTVSKKIAVSGQFKKVNMIF